MNVPATAANQRAIRLLSIIQPRSPASAYVQNFQRDVVINYLETLFPTSVSGEPDPTTRALNLQVHTDYFAAHGQDKLAGQPQPNYFLLNQNWPLMYTDSEGNFTQTQTFLTGDVNLQDKMLDGVAMTTTELEDLHTAIIVYFFTNMTDNSLWAAPAAGTVLGSNYRSYALDLNPGIIAWINHLDTLVGPIETAIFGGSCPTNSDPPDQPNSPAVTSFTDVQVILDIGESICSHGVPITQYNVYRRLSGVGNFVNIGNTVTVVNPSYLDSTVQPETAYDYHFTAVSSQGESIPSTNVTVTTLPDQGGGGDPPTDLADFLDDLFGGISNVLTGIFGGITGLDNNKLFEMKMLEVLMAGAADLAIGNLPTLADNSLELQKQIRTRAENAMAGEV